MIQKNIDCDKCFDVPEAIFTLLTPEQKELARRNHSCAFYKKNDVLFKEGDEPIGLLVLCEGKVKIFREGVGRREQIVRMVKPYGLMGFRALFAEENHIATAVALEDTVICILDKEELMKLIRENSDFAIGLIRSLATDLGFSNRRTVALTQKHIRGRLAESLLFLRDTYGMEDDEATIKIYLSREDIANLSNMTTSNAIRTLSTFASEGVISISGRKIKIVDLKKLERISSLG
ncbi:MAG: Crp/Fnr family transcriptional regulator [Salinivirgaceae bacterium]|jgi:CRP-like cAMP-binding protein|nr:Crp/Fnr family transcriptional regulator [Salinivirgaceae bacterium]